MRWSCTRWGLWCPPKGHEYHRKLPGGETARVAPFPELLGAERKYWAAGSMWQWSPQPWCCHSWEFGWFLIGFSMQGFAPVARPGCRNSHTGISREPLPKKRRTGVPSQPTAPELGLFGAPAAQFWQETSVYGALMVTTWFTAPPGTPGLQRFGEILERPNPWWMSGFAQESSLCGSSHSV